MCVCVSVCACSTCWSLGSPTQALIFSDLMYLDLPELNIEIECNAHHDEVPPPALILCALFHLGLWVPEAALDRGAAPRHIGHPENQEEAF